MESQAYNRGAQREKDLFRRRSTIQIMCVANGYTASLPSRDIHAFTDDETGKLEERQSAKDKLLDWLEDQLTALVPAEEDVD